MHSHSTSVAEFSSKSTVSVLSWLVLVVSSLFFFYEFVQMSMFNAINFSLMSDFQVTAEKLGWISSAYFYANIIFMLPAGVILDRFSTRKVIVVAMLICVLGTLLFSYAQSMTMAIVARFMTGIGGSFPLLSCMRLASRWIPVRRLAFASGLVVTIGMLGGYFAQGPLALLCEHYGWRDALRLDALFGVAVLSIIFAIVRDRPQSVSAIRRIQRQSIQAATVALEGSLKKAFFNQSNWLYGSYTSLMNLPVFLLGQTWGSLYLQQVRHLTLDQSVATTSMIFVGTIIGSPVLGYISDHMGLRKPPMILCALLAIANIAAIMLVSDLSWLYLSVLFLLLGIITSAQVISYPAIAESNDSAAVATALGLASVLIMSGGAFIEPLSGWLLDLHWDHQYLNGAPLYSGNNFFESFLIMPLAFALSLLIALWVRESGINQNKSTD